VLRVRWTSAIAGGAMQQQVLRRCSWRALGASTCMHSIRSMRHCCAVGVLLLGGAGCAAHAWHGGVGSKQVGGRVSSACWPPCGGVTTRLILGAVCWLERVVYQQGGGHVQVNSPLTCCMNSLLCVAGAATCCGPGCVKWCNRLGIHPTGLYVSSGWHSEHPAVREAGRSCSIGLCTIRLWGLSH
jgi:hypothetical protein